MNPRPAANQDAQTYLDIANELHAIAHTLCSLRFCNVEHLIKHLFGDIIDGEHLETQYKDCATIDAEIAGNNKTFDQCKADATAAITRLEALPGAAAKYAHWINSCKNSLNNPNALFGGVRLVRVVPANDQGPRPGFGSTPSA